ncbi:MAG: hypothetical protein MUF34_38285 [Polyangiaceae bacterium]|nr:hypothetical protein [Polyangiaceae bacterium]
MNRALHERLRAAIDAYAVACGGHPTEHTKVWPNGQGAADRASAKVAVDSVVLDCERSAIERAAGGAS